MKRIYLIVFALISMLLTYGISMQIKTVNNNGTTVNLTAEQSRLKSEILKINERYNNLTEEIEILEKELEKERENLTKNNSTLANLEESVKQKNALLGLKSTNFAVTIDGENIIFSVIGYGHGVGMSQTGADSLAKQGLKYEEIIKHFYTNVEIIDVNSL